MAVATKLPVSDADPEEPEDSLGALRLRITSVRSRLERIEARKRKIDARQDDIDRKAYETIAMMVAIQVRIYMIYTRT